MAGTCLPLAALLLATAVTLVLVATSAVPVAAANKYSGRMVIIRAPGARVLDVSAGGALNKWQRRRLVEDEVAPELAGGQLGASDPGIANRAFDPNHPVCPNGCSQAGEHYITRPCDSVHYCTHTAIAGHARAVHV